MHVKQLLSAGERTTNEEQTKKSTELMICMGKLVFQAAIVENSYNKATLGATHWSIASV